MNGKGDLPRPLSVPRKAFENNWDLAFDQKSKKVPDSDWLDVELQKLHTEGQSITDSPHFDSLLGVMYGKFRKERDNRGLRESDNTPEASGSTIQTPSNI